MIWAVCWKEWREQRAIALAVFAFGVLALGLTAEFADPARGGSVWAQAGARELMAQALAYLAGTVCGAMLLADEKEVGTLEFLDSLPARRRALWTGKVVFGVWLAVTHAVALALVAIAVGCVDARISWSGYAIVVVLIGLLAFAWGTFGGAVARSTLGAVFVGSLTSVVAGMALMIPFVVAFGPRQFARPFGLPLMTYYATWVAVGLAASAVMFTAVDRQRRALAGGPGLAAVRRPRRARASGLRALVWLSARQSVYVLLGCLAAAALLGAIMLAPDVMPVFLWPTATLGLGVLAGVTTLGEEQTRGVARFWAERRLPLGRLWAVKVAFHLGIALTAALVMFVPLLAASPSSVFRTRLVNELSPERARFLFLGLVYGFAVGHLASMVFRKTVVAGLVGGVTAVSFAGLLVPSVVAGGAAAWQIWLPAGLLLLTARLLLYPWATDRIASRGPVLRAAGGAGLAAAALAAGLAYRVYEIPDAPDRLAESGFERSLPTFEENEAGRQLRAAASQFRKAALDHSSLYPVHGSERGGALVTGDLLDQVGRGGWGPHAGLLGAWLDKVFAGDWPRQLDQLAGGPVGVFDDPRDRDAFSPPDPLRDLRDMAFALRARGMQRLEAGDVEAYPRLLRGGLAAVRTGRNKGGRAARDAAGEAEASLLNGLTEWLDVAPARPDLWRALLPDLIKHEREMPAGSEDIYWADQVILRNTLVRAGTWLPARLSRARPDQVEAGTPADAEAELVVFAWSVPWEKARRERLLRVQTHPDRPFPDSWLSALHLRSVWRATRVEPREGREERAQTLRRFALLEVALRIYQADHHRPAAALHDLVPTYVPAVPMDPYTGRAFGYRVSTGEILRLPPPDLSQLTDGQWTGLVAAASVSHPLRGLNGLGTLPGPRPGRLSVREQMALGMTAPPVQWPPSILVFSGDGVVWSAGPDRKDDGGHRPMIPRGAAEPGADWIVVIPPLGR